MVEPIALVTKPTAQTEVRESIVAILRKTLNEAEAGEITSLVILAEDADGDWINRSSDTQHFSKSIGRLTITLIEWVMRYSTNAPENKSL